MIRKGDILEIDNDDNYFVHHAYVEDPAFSFDSEDQELGGTTDIAFTTPGAFTVLCGIHPKMQMAVIVLK